MDPEKKEEKPQEQEPSPEPVTQQKEEVKQKIDIENVVAGEEGVDYEKLIKEFGCQKITPEQIEKIESLSGMKAHRFLRRGIFFSHRDLDFILKSFENGKGFYLYTGRGPSSESLHLGHTIPFTFTKYLQEAFDVPLVIQITDDEKFLHKEKLTLEQTIKMGMSNIKDIIAFGFNPEKTFIFRDTDYIRELYPNVLRVQKAVTLNQIKGIFGVTGSSNSGKIAFPAVQAAPSFSTSFEHIFGAKSKVPCLIPQAIDQDPYFRMTRDVARKLKYHKPACIHSTFFPAIQGKSGKMSASNVEQTIFLTDTANQIKKKINKHAFSGGQDTAELQKELGANIDIDVPYQFLQFFLEDDEEYKEIGIKYAKGEMMTGEVKKICIEKLQDFVKEYQERRAQVTDEDVERFMEKKSFDLVSSKFPEKKEEEESK